MFPFGPIFILMYWAQSLQSQNSSTADFGEFSRGSTATTCPSRKYRNFALHSGLAHCDTMIVLPASSTFIPH